MRSNKIFVKQQAKNVDLVVNSTRDSYAVKVRNLYLFMRSQDFRYNLWFVPVKATLDVEVASVGLDFEVQLGNTTLNTTLPSGETLTRTLPQIEVTRCELQLDPKKMSFNIGGSMIAQLVDVVVPLFTRLISVILEDRVRSLVTQEELPSLFNGAVVGS